MTNDRDNDNRRPGDGELRHLDLETLNAYFDNQLHLLSVSVPQRTLRTAKSVARN